jgi:DNA-binding transcriptional regulator YiaG
MSELFDAVDALIASRSPLPPPAERKRLRQAHGLTLDEVASALQVRRATVSGWEVGKTEPRPPERDAYARMLKQLAQLYPANAPVPPEGAAIPETPAVPAAPAPSAAEPAQAPAPTGPTAEPANTALRPAALPLYRARRPRPGRRRAVQPLGRLPPQAPRRAAPIRVSRTVRSRSSTSTQMVRCWRTASAAWS